MHDDARLRPPPPPSRRRSESVPVRITERDRRLFSFAAEHRLVLSAHVQALLGVSPQSADGRLRALTRAGYLRYDRKLSGPGWYHIDRPGLGAIGSSLPRPRDVDLATYRHDVGLAWLWLAARAGAFGPLDAVISERRMRSHDGGEPGRADRFGVRLAGVGPRGGQRRHYPDLLLETRTGHRAAVELELTLKSPTRREQILGGYVTDPRIDAVLYLVESRSVGRAMASSAAGLGMSPMVHVQPVSFRAPGRSAPARAVERVAGRPTGVPTLATREPAR